MESGDPVEGDGGTYTIDWPDAGPVQGTRCPECGGSGAIVLLVTKRPCTACGGTGVVAAKPITSYQFDRSTIPGSDPA
jgi:DnaJ-class molecular chaperone